VKPTYQQVVNALQAATNDVILAAATAKAEGDYKLAGELFKHSAIYQDIIRRANNA
jgi:hypothetical protein